jgi:hypothetical protein
MFALLEKKGRRLLLVLATLALATAACSSSTGTTAPGGGGNATPNAPAATDQPGGNGGGSGLGSATGAFANMSSYKFKMTLAGGTFGSMLSMLGGAGASGSGALTVSGTVVTKPDVASDIEMSGFHIIEIGGFDYIDLGMGGYTKSAATGSSMADGFSPEKMFSSAISASSADGYTKVGSESKNGVDTDHYQASTAALAQYGSVLGVAGATWSSDVWIAKDGGYPVSMAMIATATDKSVAYEILFDLTNVNDPANKVTAPTNVMGA